jgi:hypothetical protein
LNADFLYVIYFLVLAVDIFFQPETEVKVTFFFEGTRCESGADPPL